jgi:GTP-binding protein
MVEMARQTRQAIDEADVILFVVDARGLTSQDRDGRKSCASGRRVPSWSIKPSRPPSVAAAESEAVTAGDLSSHREFQILSISRRTAEGGGTPAGKWITRLPSLTPNAAVTLVNALLAPSVLVFNEPGPTRDAIQVEFEWDASPTRSSIPRAASAASKQKAVVFRHGTIQAIADASMAILISMRGGYLGAGRACGELHTERRAGRGGGRQ